VHTTYTLNTDELTSQFILVLQQTYPGKKVEIAVQEAQDETEYLLKDSQLLKAVDDIRNGKNLVSVPLESFLLWRFNSSSLPLMIINNGL